MRRLIIFATMTGAVIDVLILYRRNQGNRR